MRGFLKGYLREYLRWFLLGSDGRERKRDLGGFRKLFMGLIVS